MTVSRHFEFEEQIFISSDRSGTIEHRANSPDELVNFTDYDTRYSFNAGKIVRYNGEFYQAQVHTSNNLTHADWLRVPPLKTKRRVLGFTFRRGLEFGGDRPFSTDVAGYLSVTITDERGQFSRWGGGAYTDLTDRIIQVRLPRYDAVNARNLQGAWGGIAQVYRTGDVVSYGTKVDGNGNNVTRYWEAVREGTGAQPDMPPSFPTVQHQWREIIASDMFIPFILWTGYIDNVKYVPSTTGLHTAIIEAYGLLRRLNEIRLSAPALAETSTPDLTPSTAFAHIRSHLPADLQVLLSAGIADPTQPKYLMDYWFAENNNALDAMRELAIADNGVLLERRGGEMLLLARAALTQPSFNRAHRKMVSLYGGLTSTKASAQIIANHKALNAEYELNRIQTDKEVSVGSADARRPHAYIEELDLQAPEEPLLNRIDWNVPTYTLATDQTIWQAEVANEDNNGNEYFTLQGGVGVATPAVVRLTRTGANPEDAEWVDVIGAVQGVAIVSPNPMHTQAWEYDALTPEPATTPHILQEPVALNSTSFHYRVRHNVPTSNHPILLLTFDLHGQLLTKDDTEITAVQESPTSLQEFGEHSKTMKNLFYNYERATASGVLGSMRANASSYLSAYHQAEMRPLVTVNGATAGRAAVEELLNPYNNVELETVGMHAGEKEQFIIRAVRYERNGNNPPKIEVMLKPKILEGRIGAIIGNPNTIIGGNAVEIKRG